MVNRDKKDRKVWKDLDSLLANLVRMWITHDLSNMRVINWWLKLYYAVNYASSDPSRSVCPQFITWGTAAVKLWQLRGVICCPYRQRTRKTARETAWVWSKALETSNLDGSNLPEPKWNLLLIMAGETDSTVDHYIILHKVQYTHMPEGSPHTLTQPHTHLPLQQFSWAIIYYIVYLLK